MSLFFCQFLSAVGVFKKDCRHILRSCRLSVKPLGRPLIFSKLLYRQGDLLISENLRFIA